MAVDYNPFTQQYPEGTHFSDGVRVGPIYPASYSVGAVGGNFQTPVFNESPADSSAPGVKIGPEFIYSITPYAASNTVLRGSDAPAIIEHDSWVNFNLSAVPAQQVGFIDATRIFTSQTLQLGITAPGYNASSNAVGAGVLNNSFTQGYVFDVPRCVSVTTNNVAETQTGTLTAYGIDAYGFPVASTISLTLFETSGGLITAVFPKAMKVLLGIYLNNASNTAASYSFGTSDVYGLPYRLTNTSLAEAVWNGIPVVVGTGVVQTQLAALAASNAIGKFVGSPMPYATGNLTPASTATSSDVRGLVMLPGYSQAAGTVAAAQSNLTTTSNYYNAKTLIVKMYLPFANTSKPALYNNPAPAGFTPGHMVLSAPYSGGPLCLPTPQSTTAFDLYGSSQFWYA